MTSSSSGSCGSERNRSVSHISAGIDAAARNAGDGADDVPTIIAISMAARPTASEMRPP